jgi:pyruvate kinase
MILSYGSYPINIELINKKTGQTYLNTDEIYDQSICLAEDKKLVRCGDMVIFVAGTPLWVLGEANLIQVKTVEDYLFTTQV